MKRGLLLLLLVAALAWLAAVNRKDIQRYLRMRSM